MTREGASGRANDSARATRGGSLSSPSSSPSSLVVVVVADARAARDDDARGRFTAPARDRIRVTRATDRPRHRVEMTMKGRDGS